MVTVYDVPAEQLIAKVAVKLREIDTIKPPEWAEFVRTGRHTEKAPVQRDWWYTRSASILRKVAIKGPIGTSRLAEEYGGYADRGSRPNKAVKGSRNIARKSVMQLEASGLVAKSKNKGRIVTSKGQKLLDAAAKEVADAAK
ncbi:MAG TPA: 30S ribosomal protein S19e [Methanomassiliicoccales archaeon]|nr:30S ribosomal protein S19e [Methanomassiliicoccales archaeon]